MPPRHRTLALIAASAALPALAAAQTFATGLLANEIEGKDATWTVTCRQVIETSGIAAPCNSTTASPAQQASIVTARPGGWATVPTVGGARYISVLSTASVFHGTPNEDARFEYVFRRTFNAPAGGPFTLFLNLFRLDNYLATQNPVSVTLNGVSGVIMPMPGAPNTANWQTNRTVTFSNVIASPSDNNVLEIAITGNGRTDGILVDGRLNVVPEPSTYALMATGMAGLLAVARRRRVQG